MRILLTGASGEIGTPLRAALRRDGHDLTILSRRVGPFPAEAGSTWVRGDLADRGSLAGAVTPDLDAVIHMAAVTHTRRVADYFETNVEGTRRLLEVCAVAEVPHFVHLSTRAIGAEGGAYAASKAEAESLVQASPLPWTILRPAEVYGSGGEDPVLSLGRSLQQRSWVPVLGDGSYQLAPVHAEDVVEAVVRCLSPTLPRGRTYLLAGPESLSYGELIDRLEQLLGLPRRRRVRVPLAIARLLIRGMATCGVGGYVPDQVPRLLLHKATDSAAAARDLGFAPRDLATGLLPLLTPRG